MLLLSLIRFGFEDQDFVSKYLQKKSKKKNTGLRPAPTPYGAAPLPPTKVSAKFLAAVVLAHPDSALGHVSLCFGFFHRFPRMLDVLSFPYTFFIAAITLGSLAFTSTLLSASLAR